MNPYRTNNGKIYNGVEYFPEESAGINLETSPFIRPTFFPCNIFYNEKLEVFIPPKCAEVVNKTSFFQRLKERLRLKNRKKKPLKQDDGFDFTELRGKK